MSINQPNETLGTAQVPPETPELQIGAFSGYNRRPLPDRSGLTAQFYGENGDDADMISALSLTKFLEADVYVKIHLIKDSVGQIMKRNGSFPMISSFKAKVQRPKGLKEGMVANLFAANGDDSDQVNILGLSKFLDAFVYVEILKPEAAPEQTIPAAPLQDALLPEISAELDSLAHHLTPFERKALQKKTKAYVEANRLLKMSGFLRQPSVWTQLGTELDYQAWLDAIPCCAPGNTPCTHTATAFKIPSESHQRYALVPFCKEHAIQADAGLMPGGIAFLRMRRDVLIQEWAWERLLAMLSISVSTHTEPDPQKIFAWAHEHKLTQHIPANYLNKFS
jgi:hypothetical protein